MSSLFDVLPLCVPHLYPCPVQLSPVQWQLLGEGLLHDSLQVWKHYHHVLNTPEQYKTLPLSQILSIK